MTADELIERVMTEHWDIGACPCAFCKSAHELGYRPRSCYPTNPATSILDDRWNDYGKPLKPEYDFAVREKANGTEKP